MLRTDDLDYHLPEELIATTPAEPRDAARLLVVSRSDPARLEHRHVRDLPEFLGNDLMAVNTTRVLPARFRGVRLDTNGAAEGLFVAAARASFQGEPIPPSAETRSIWTVLLKMRRMRPGVVVRLLDHSGASSGICLRLIERTGEDNGAWNVAVENEQGAGLIVNSPEVLARIGLTPLPPYIRAARKAEHLEVPDDRDRATYQTIYATDRGERPGCGSVAAPTAGLHFTPELLARLAAKGVHRAEITLDVGLGTFKPIETEFVEQHPMHTEWCGVPEETAHAIMDARRDPRTRIIAVGTTSARTLESFDSPEEMLRVKSKETRILITPGYRFKHIDALMTNFHLPKSTLMAMVAAFLVPPESPDAAQGVSRLKAIYAEAVGQGYRFYSYGDAMLILP